MARLPVTIMFQCSNCESIIAFVSLQWKTGKQYRLPCAVCPKEYFVAFALAPVDEATIPDYVLKAFNNAGNGLE